MIQLYDITFYVVFKYAFYRNVFQITVNNTYSLYMQYLIVSL